jgi:cytochrome c-type biogenesis protein CcmH/NrfG
MHAGKSQTAGGAIALSRQARARKARAKAGVSEMSTLWIVLLVVLLLALGGGYYGSNAGWGPWGWSPVGIVLVILVLLLITGRL